MHIKKFTEKIIAYDYIVMMLRINNKGNSSYMAVQRIFVFTLESF
jgi:hypothetical protein